MPGDHFQRHNVGMVAAFKIATRNLANNLGLDPTKALSYVGVQ
jgi:hypothetical protein